MASPSFHCLTARKGDIIRALFQPTTTKPKENRTMAHKIAADKCVGCGCCKDACPAEAISEGTPYTIDPDKCVDCGACAAQCPNEAINPA